MLQAAHIGGTMTEALSDPLWSWQEERWRGVVTRVRAGRSLKPKKWKGGARAAVALSFNLGNEIGALARSGASIVELSQGHYGARSGLARCLALLRRHSVPATFFVPAVAAMLYAEDLKAIIAGGHEIALNGWIGEINTALSGEVERDLLVGARDALERMTGVKPQGIRAAGHAFSENTLGLMRELGLLYDSSLMADDEPYELLDNGQPTGLIEVPPDHGRNDATFFGAVRQGQAPASGEAVFDNFRRELELAFEEGGLFQLSLSPDLIGHRSRLWVLDETLKLARTLPGVWFATHQDIALWCKSKAGG